MNTLLTDEALELKVRQVLEAQKLAKDYLGVDTIVNLVNSQKKAWADMVMEQMRPDLRHMIAEVSSEGEQAATTKGVLIKVPIDGRINKVFEAQKQRNV